MRAQDLDQILESFAQFWLYYFPEMNTVSREKAMAVINDRQEGQTSNRPDAEMVAYQDRVAGVYGAYEQAQYQMATIFHILTNVATFPSGGHLVSLGAGPGSYELWLLTVTKLSMVTLVDHSPAMLDRARKIAMSLEETSRMKTIVADASASKIPDVSADVVFSINAAHWSRDWRRWVAEAARIAKPGAEIFFTVSLGHPRSGIDIEELKKVFGKYFDIVNMGFLMPPQQLPGGQMAYSSRFFIVGRKK